ncbi:hypothetical protein IGI04_030099 [Brassica rapa subsp. trilocularis]|uniref:Zinc finger GRF-type domain-containing protein n=1 Tax=Brassica rapa subsp. trilocularis TaxID=1813537 RepID=A0ABQ7LSH6_BRACM|nr:hypothetical protein IGI04_030099 [Brassica rapa subsp. trilocularis]
MGSIIAYASFSLNGREMTGMPLKGGIKKNEKENSNLGGGGDFGLGFGLGLVWVSVESTVWLLFYSSHPRRSSLLSQVRSSLTATASVIDVDSYSGDAVEPQRFHRLAFFRIGRNAALPEDLSDQSIIPSALLSVSRFFLSFPRHFFTSPPLSIPTLSHYSYTLSLSILFLYSLKIHGFTLSLLLNMTHPYEEMKEMKRLKKHYDMLGFVADAQYGIPTRCPCGGEIMTNVSPTPKYKSDFDTLPGSRYFTCKNYEDDGLHFRQPWAFGVQQEVERLRGEVKELAEEIAKLKRLITSTSHP